jgi:hypothetical protein
MRVHFGLSALLAALVLALPAAGQEPKVGDYYEDRTDLGFKVRVPQKWEPIPPTPDDGNLVIKFDPKTNKTIQVGKGAAMPLSVWILKFDRRKPASMDTPASPGTIAVHRVADVEHWMKESQRWDGFKRVEPSKELQIEKVAASESIYASTEFTRDHDEVRVYVCLFKIRPDIDVAFVGWGPGESKRWSKFESSFREMARSFRNVEVEDKKTALAADASLRDKKRAELQDQITRTPGWKLYESPNYFIVSSNPDKAFLDELMQRLEAIRTVYEQDYPASKAKALREQIALTTTGEKAKPPDPGEKPPDPAAKPPDPDRPKDPKGNGDDEEDGEGDDGAKKDGKEQPKRAQPPEPDFALSQELSKCSVVRVCKNAGEYHAYGGPPMAAGHWDASAGELVVYDDRANGGKGDTWITLNHEAFHQYIFYFYGNLAPHSWYNEGTGDFYSGYSLKNNRFTLEKNLWRRDTIKEAIHNDKFVPLGEIMRWGQKEYYGMNKLQTSPVICYAEGWSLIWFLRTGKKNKAKGWNPKWDTLLDDYLKALVTTRNRSKAIEACLKDVDMDALQAAWIDYTK